jgi:hypothetical protein
MKRFIGILLFLALSTACSTSQEPLMGQILIEKAPAPTAAAAPLTDSALVEDYQSEPDPLLDEIYDLTERRKEDLLTQSGWLHLITRRTNGGAGLFSSDLAESGLYDQDEWLYFDEGGQVTRAVVRVMDASWEPVQVSVMLNGFWHDLSTGAETQSGGVADFTLGLDVYNQAKELVNSDQKLAKGTLYHNCWYIGEQYTIKDGELQRYVVIDPDDATLRELKTFDLSSGSIELVDSVELLKEERVDQPPDEILALFDEVPEQ